jgi:hypothetical protein
VRRFPLANLARGAAALRRTVSLAGPKCPVFPACVRGTIPAVSARAMSARLLRLIAGLALAASLSAGCAHKEYFPGTTIVRNEDNRKIIETIEQYRRRLMEHNVEGLLVLASPKYFEDSGTPRSDDDYGYEGLRQVLATQLRRVKSLRYDIEYRNIRINDNEAEVEVFLDGSFELAADSGDRYRRVNDYHRFRLERQGDEWKFLAGM